MESVYEKGLAKAIGISNFTITKTENLLKTAKVVPAVNQGYQYTCTVIYIIILCSGMSSIFSAARSV